MPTRLTLICHGPTAATRTASFPDDEALEEGVTTQPLGFPVTKALTSPALRAHQSAALLGLKPEIEPQIRDCDYGRWTGRRLADLQAEDPPGVAAWLADPEARPHGGESLLQLVARVSGWLDALRQERGALVAVTHAAVIRAAILTALEAPASAFWRVDVEPFGRAELAGDGRRWALRLAHTRARG